MANLPEGVFLRYPENLGSHQNIDFETAVTMLLRAIPLSQQVPFSWGYIDKPQEGQVFLIFLPTLQAPFPSDGIRFLEQEARHAMPANNRELEIYEAKFGFIPGSQDTGAWRIRRRFRLSKGGHPQLVLIHYSRGPLMQIPPPLLTQPIRHYPLRPVNEPAIYVAGDRMGQKVFPHGAMPNAPPNVPNPHAMGGMNNMGGGAPNIPMSFNRQAQMLAQQSGALEALERRSQRDPGTRDRSGSTAAVTRPPVVEDESGDEAESISTKTLAINRYKRNHELMNEVFRQAALGDKNTSPSKPPYAIFNKAELDTNIAKLEAEIEALGARKRPTKVDQHSNLGADVPMQDLVHV
ncbi:hypothetical protein EYR36_005052 [Pleurotus pulmonarius]|nr:hypothetical protein EYR36_005052 [Pleurotus pulmonarius]